MSPYLPCPYLPASEPGADWRSLNRFRQHDRGKDFYYACLRYGQFLWERRLAGRAILCLDRAMGAELQGNEPILEKWPVPYEALVWILTSCPTENFVGNPRVHFQHYADRLKGPRAEQRRWRAWACWRLTCIVTPHWPGDPKHVVEAPTDDSIGQGLNRHGFAGEELMWRKLLSTKASHVVPASST